MQYDRLESAFDRVGHAQMEVKTGLTGAGGDSLVECLDQRAARVFAEQAKDHHTRAGATRLVNATRAKYGVPEAPLASACTGGFEHRMSRGFSTTLTRLLIAASVAVPAAACIGEEFQRGYLIDERTVHQVKPGMSAEQVLQTLGTPSTVSTVGNKSWYYISQISKRPVAFMSERIVDQRVTAVYFDRNLKVERVALYGIRDGKVFDFISRTTPTSGSDQSFVAQMFKGLGSLNPF
jgi:outer membrane protein assembly factor BamE (lipoprotein component of BamABCDE complex)